MGSLFESLSSRVALGFGRVRAPSFTVQQSMHSHYKLMILLLVAAVMISPPLFGAPINSVHAPHAMVVSQHELASRAGVEIMQAGGNAVDASVATGFALAVVHPPAGNLGGGGFMLLRTADGNVHFIDYREKAPAAATATKIWQALTAAGYRSCNQVGPRRFCPGLGGCQRSPK